jgi:anti-sigma-K factor RskA
VVVSQVKPGLIAGRFHIPQLVAQSSPPPPAAAAPSPGGQLIAVLQQDPSAPAFLLSIDPATKKMTVRTVAAKGEADHSFELWLVEPRPARPVSLGLIGSTEYTELSLPADLDAAAMAAATYAVSFEPAGGSKTGAPTGPILFTGKLVEALPPPSAPKI